MSRKWIKTKYPGVRYREAKQDRWYAIRHTHCGTTKEEGVGWASDGITAKKASLVLAQIKHNQSTGSGPTSLAEMRAQEQDKQDRAAVERVERKTIPQTFSDMAKEYKAWSQANKSSWEVDHRYLDLHVLPVIGGLKTDQVSTQVLERYKSGLAQKGFAPASIVHCLGLIRRCYTFARDMYPGYWEQIAPHGIPTQNVTFPRVQNSRVRYLTKHEAKVVLDAAKKTDPLMHDIVWLALGTGMRRNEIANLRSHKVHIEQRLIMIPAAYAKSGQDETVCIPDQLISLLQNILCSKSPTDLVFPSTRTGGPLKSISPRFKKVIDATGLNRGIDDPRDRIVFHTLRHTYISWLVMEGTDIRTVQGMARHRSIDMTMRYAHLAPSNLSQAANRLPEFGPDLIGP